MIHLNIGSNLDSKYGTKFENISIAVNLLINSKLKIKKISNFYETPSYPNKQLPKYVNIGILASYNFSYTKLIKEISKERQVICITHQPYLAAAAKAHFKVKKNVIEGLTFTSIKKLTTKIERQNELTELIGGGFEEANDYASILIEKAAA